MGNWELKPLHFGCPNFQSHCQDGRFYSLGSSGGIPKPGTDVPSTHGCLLELVARCLFRFQAHTKRRDSKVILSPRYTGQGTPTCPIFYAKPSLFWGWGEGSNYHVGGAVSLELTDVATPWSDLFFPRPMTPRPSWNPTVNSTGLRVATEETQNHPEKLGFGDDKSMHFWNSWSPWDLTSSSIPTWVLSPLDPLNAGFSWNCIALPMIPSQFCSEWGETTNRFTETFQRTKLSRQPSASKNWIELTRLDLPECSGPSKGTWDEAGGGEITIFLPT